MAAKGSAKQIGFTVTNASTGAFTTNEEVPVGSIIFFRSDESATAHVGNYGGKHWVTHEGGASSDGSGYGGPSFCTIEAMNKKGYNLYLDSIYTPPVELEDNGTIEVYKKDTNGKNLSGAVFVATSTTTGKEFRIGPTNANGYAEAVDPIPYNTYLVKETVFPKNYRGYGQTQWTVTVGKANNGVVTVHAVNEEIPGSCKIIKTSEDGKVGGIAFNISGNGINQNVVTKNDGTIQVDELKPGVYTVTETVADKYEPQETRHVTVVTGQVSTVTFNNTLKRGDLSVTKTAEDGLVEGLKFHLTGTSLSGLPVDEYAVTNQNGVALFKDVLIGTGYVLSEADTPVRYVVPDNQKAAIEWNTVTKETMDNRLKKWNVTVTKSDEETGTAQGNASLVNAKYGVYKGEQLIDAYATDKNGQFTTKYYVCADDWSVREISPSEGYLLSSTVYSVGAEAKRYIIEYNSAPALDVTESIIKGNLSIIKHTDNGDTQIETPEAGAEFEVYLKSTGSYNTAKESERDILVCDENGFAQTKDMPYGVYTVHQTKGWEGKELLPDFDVFISQHGVTYRYLLNNAPFEAYVKVVKVDAETGKAIPYAGAAFELYNPDGSRVTMTYTYPEVTVIDTFYTNAEGYLITPEKLPYGKGYALVEKQAPYGYVLNSDPLLFDLTEENAAEDTAVTVVAVERPNMPQKGTITIEKSGEVFASVTKSENVYQPVYAVKGLAGAVYQVTAAEDIYTPDDTLRYRKGEAVDTVTTNADGKAVSKELYLGKYDITEITAPYGMILNTEVRHVELTYAGQEVAVTETAASFVNERQKIKIDLGKVLEKNETFGIGVNGEILSVQFGLFAAEDLTAADGPVIPADGLLEIVHCSEDGKAAFATDVPVGAKLYVKEMATDSHYILSDTKYAVTFAYAGQDVVTVQFSVNNGETISNDIIYGTIKGLKIDRETEETIAGALFGLFRADETVFTEDTAILTAESKEDGIFTFSAVPYGNWIVRELKPAEGFLPNEETYPVAVSENEQLIEITVVNDRIPEIGTTATVDGEKEINATEIFTLTDTVSYKHLVPGKEYVLTGVLMDKSTGKPLMINGEEIRSEVTFTPETPSGEVTVEFVFDAKYIKQDTQLVAFETLSRDGKELTVHADINDEGQTVTVHVPEIGTQATADGKKEIFTGGSVTIDDVVSYKNLTPGKEYTLKGVLMNKATGQPLLVNGQTVTSEATFTPEGANGEVTVTFTFNANGLITTTEIVVFENLYRDGIEIAAHTDITDENQTVKITPPTPDIPQTGDNSNMGFWIGLGAIALGGLIACVVIGIKRKKDDGDDDE